MALFSYIALDRNGQRIAGTVPADSRASALDTLTGRGLSPLSVVEQNGSVYVDRSSVSDRNQGRVPRKAVESFTRELANLLAGGVSLARALALLKREASHPAAKNVWTCIHDDVVGGASLADAMSRWPAVFSPVYVAMVRAGETGGFLAVVLQQIADFRQREQDLIGKVKSAMIYPIVLAGVATIVLLLMLTVFIPWFQPMFEQAGQNLPLLTRIVMGISGWLLSYGLLLLALGGVGLFVLRRYLRTDPGRRVRDRLILKMPGAGLVIARFSLVRFARMMGTLIQAGVPLVAALRVAREAIGNATLSDTVDLAIDQVQQGTPLSRALGTNPLLFPPGVIEMIAVAEESGRLDQEMLRMSQAYEAELDRALRMLVALLEPAMLLVMAAAIGTVVVSMVLPLFALQDMIN